jgi:hypothetical protein
MKSMTPHGITGLQRVNRFMFVIEVLGVFYEAEKKYSNSSSFREVNQ